jgi:signal transduction histidine kinase/ActR/RegA family two-component response regulator
MTSPQGLKIGRRLTLLLALFIALILGGNGLIIFQFARARLLTNRLTGVSQQLIAVLKLQHSLLAFHQRLNDIAQSGDGQRFVSEAQPLRTALLDQIRETRRGLVYMSAEFRAGPAFLTALDTIETTLPMQLRDLTTLATAGDWDVVRLRVDNELNRIETMTAALVKNIDQDLDEELPRAVVNMRDVQRRIFLIVPLTAISTVIVAAFFGWAISRRMMDLRLEERVNERTRIARDFHDTLLQSFQALLMKFHALTYLIPERPDVQQKLEGVLEQARQAITEGRDAVQGLRSSTVVAHDLAGAIGKLGEELARDQAGQNCPEFRVRVEGKSRDLSPLVRDEVYQIACEAVRNAFRHAHAQRIEVEIRYDPRRFRLHAMDNGKGIDATVLSAGARAGHHGLPGMNERAELAGGKLAVRSGRDSGTEVELSIPASVAYRKTQIARPAVQEKQPDLQNEDGSRPAMDQRRIRLLSADDHALLREGIASLISHQSDMVLVSQASGGREAIQQYREHRPDVTLMDLRMPDLSGIEALLAIRSECPEARIIILTTFESDEEVRRAAEAGACGYLLKSLPPSQLVRAIRDVHAGKKAIGSAARFP